MAGLSTPSLIHIEVLPPGHIHNLKWSHAQTASIFKCDAVRRIDQEPALRQHKTIGMKVPRLSGSGAAAARRRWLWTVAFGTAVLLMVACFTVGWRLGLRWTEVTALGGALQAAAGSFHAQAGSSLAIAEPVRLCQDTCHKAKDGVCDEGRPTSYSMSEVHCDLGTDCTDCGAYVGHKPPGKWSEGGPVAHLKALNLKTFTVRTRTTPSFQVLFVDPELDLDVSSYLKRSQIIEAGITQIFQTVLQGNCYDKATGKRQLVLDVGANFGYFSVYAALMGCRVVAWEPVPHFRAFLSYALGVNNVSHLVTIRDRVVTDTDNQQMTMQVPTKGIWGTASVKGINQLENQKATEVSVVSERVDSVIHEDVLLMKVDVEGFEPVVIKSAAGLIDKWNVENIILEYNPGVAERTPYVAPKFTHLITDNPVMLQHLMTSGYNIGLMVDDVAKGPRVTRETFPALPRISQAQIKYDIKDSNEFRSLHEALVQNRTDLPRAFNCPVKIDLVRLNGQWGNCALMPDDAHPKSVRSAFPFNCNLWATRSNKHIKFSNSTPATMQLHQDARQQWSSSTAWGTGARSCSHLPASHLVRNRCSCKYALQPEPLTVCLKEQNMVDQLMTIGVLKFEDNEHAQ